MDFFRDARVSKQIGDYILDRQPIDEQQLQQLFEQHQQNGYAVSKALMQRKGLTAKSIVDEFLQCYRQILSQQLSIPEMSILLDVLNQNASIIQQMQNSEEQLKQHIDALQQTQLSPAALQMAYQTGQQQLVTSTVNLIQARQTTNTQMQLIPRLFTDGFCKGRPLHPSNDRYFVSHGFDPNKLTDWRQVIASTLSHANNSTQPLQPYFSGDTLLGGFRLCSICERLYSTAFSLFLLPTSQDRNVYLELGIAIGLGKPFLLIRERDATIPPVLTSLTFYTHGGSFRTMRRELAGQVEEYDFGAVQFTKDDTALQVLPRYLIAAGETIEDEDFEYSITNAINKAYTQQSLVVCSLSDYLEKMQGMDLRQLVELIQTCRFALYQVDEQCSPTTFLALGISIGLNRPFLMLGKAGNTIPQDLRGLGIYQFANFTQLEDEVVTWHHTFLDTYIR